MSGGIQPCGLDDKRGEVAMILARTDMTLIARTKPY